MSGLSVALVRRREAARRLAPGLLLSATIALAATFLAERYGAPAMLFALLIGVAFHFLAEEGPCREGVEFASKQVLRLGVALLGARIGLGEIAALGWPTVGAVAGLVGLTILSGFLFAPLFGRGWRFGLLTAGATAICGASAALALAAVIPANDRTARNTLFTVIAVTTLSTVAMVLYPPLFGLLDLSDAQMGFLIGATIHDVAQVVGAGYSVSETAGDTATIVKLFRVALLPVALLAVTLALRGRGGPGGVTLPWFLVAFVALATLNSAVALPPALVEAVAQASRAMLVTAIAALGVKTSMKAMVSLGAGHAMVVVLETLFLLVAALAALHFLLDL